MAAIRFNPTSSQQYNNLNSNDVTKQHAPNKNVSFGIVLRPNNHTELTLGQVKELSGGKLPISIVRGLAKLLGSERVLKYASVPSALHKEQFVLGKPGLNEYGNPKRTWINKVTSSGEVNGSGNSIKEALKSLIKRAKDGTLVD